MREHAPAGRAQHQTVASPVLEGGRMFFGAQSRGLDGHSRAAECRLLVTTRFGLVQGMVLDLLQATMGVRPGGVFTVLVSGYGRLTSPWMQRMSTQCVSGLMSSYSAFHHCRITESELRETSRSGRHHNLKRIRPHVHPKQRPSPLVHLHRLHPRSPHSLDPHRRRHAVPVRHRRVGRWQAQPVRR